MRIFIGSSGKNSNWAEEMALYLQEIKHEPLLWSKTGTFTAGGYTLENIYEIAGSVDAGLFILAPDDELTTSEFITRDNVIFEAGMYFGLKGKQNVALCVVEPKKTSIPSDLKGLTYISLNQGEYQIKKALREWIKKADILPAMQPNNVLMGSREEIEAYYTIENRFEMIEHIKEIKILNLASTSVVSPILIDYYSESSKSLSAKIQEALKRGIYVELIITEPGTYAMNDALKKVANRNLANIKDRRAVFYGAYASLNESLHDTGSEYYKAYNRQPKQFNYYLTDISLPFSIFCIEFKPGYEEYNNIKIDLYSAELKAEKYRRSMVISQKYDYKNYEFFHSNYDDIRMSCLNNERESQFGQEWLKEWYEIKTRLFGK